MNLFHVWGSIERLEGFLDEANKQSHLDWTEMQKTFRQVARDFTALSNYVDAIMLRRAAWKKETERAQVDLVDFFARNNGEAR